MKITEPFKPFEAGGKVYHGYILTAADELDEQIESYLKQKCVSFDKSSFRHNLTPESMKERILFLEEDKEEGRHLAPLKNKRS